MTRQAEIVFQQDHFLVSGDLTMSNVMATHEQSLKLFATQPVLVIDLSQLGCCDSSALALLLDWIVFAKKTNRAISFRHLPSELMSIAKAAGLEALLLSFTV